MRRALAARVAMIQTGLWRVVDPRALSHRAWDGELVVYNDVTGHTHHLAPLGGAVLRALLQHPDGVEMSALIPLLAYAIDTSDMQSLVSDLERTLSELADLELVGCVPA